MVRRIFLDVSVFWTRAEMARSRFAIWCRARSRHSQMLTICAQSVVARLVNGWPRCDLRLWCGVLLVSWGGENGRRSLGCGIALLYSTPACPQVDLMSSSSMMCCTLSLLGRMIGRYGPRYTKSLRETGHYRMLDLSSPFHAYPSMHTVVLPSPLLSMRSYTSWTSTIDQYAFQSSFAALLTPQPTAPPPSRPSFIS